MRDGIGVRGQARLNPLGNARLTALVGVLLLAPVLVELATIVLGVHSFMSLHVFVGLALIPVVLLKLASTGWRFARYYTRSVAYVDHGAPQLAMRVLAPLFVVATVVLFASGVGMGLLHGHGLAVARRLHGPASVAWLVLFGIHALVYLRQAVTGSGRELDPAAPPVPGRRRRGYLIATAVAAGLLVGVATVPAQHHWVRLHRDRHRGEARPQYLRASSSRSPAHGGQKDETSLLSDTRRRRASLGPS
jgi:hypothetical protein